MVLFALVLQARLVVVVSFLECCHHRANVFHGGASTLHGNPYLIDYTLGKALSSQWACLFSSSAVATLLSLQTFPGCRGKYTGIVAFHEQKIKDCIKVPPPIETSAIKLHTDKALFSISRLSISHLCNTVLDLTYYLQSLIYT